MASQSWSEYQNSRKRPEKRVSSRPEPKPEPPGGICTIPMDIVLKTVRTNPLSDFLYFLCNLFDTDTIMRLIEEYAIGVTAPAMLSSIKLTSKVAVAPER